VAGIVGWLLLDEMPLRDFCCEDVTARQLLYLLPPLAWALPLLAFLLFRRLWNEVAGVLLLLVPAALIHMWLLAIYVRMWGGASGSAMPSDVREYAAAVLLGTGWLALAYGRCRWMRDAQGGALRALRYGVDLVEMLLLIAFIGAGSLLLISRPHVHPSSVRSRIADLVLASSSARTALSEGMQTYGSWSPQWMRAITISATGFIDRALIGPTGVITIYGNAPTSYAVITMTPTVTVDNKLVWSCTGSPARYMPASCR
jgi:type IV pilus assembly protein PilA